MTTARQNALARINDQISKSESLLAGALTDWEIRNVTDELTKLEADRLKIETQLQNEINPSTARGISYSEALAMAKAQIYSEALAHGGYVPESTIEEKANERATEIMRNGLE